MQMLEERVGELPVIGQDRAQIIPAYKKRELLMTLDSIARGRVLDTRFNIDDMVKNAKDLVKLQAKIDRNLEIDRWDGTAKAIYSLFCRISAMAGIKIREVGELLQDEEDRIAKLFDTAVDIYSTFKSHQDDFTDYRTGNNSSIEYLKEERINQLSRRNLAENDFLKYRDRLSSLDEEAPGFHTLKDSMWCARDTMREYAHRVSKIDYYKKDMTQTSECVDNATQLFQYGRHFSEDLATSFMYSAEKVRELGPGVMFANKIFKRTPEIVLIALAVSKTVNQACTIATNASNLKNLERAYSRLESASSLRNSSQLAAHLDGKYRR